MGRYRVTFSSLVQVQLLSKWSEIRAITWLPHIGPVNEKLSQNFAEAWAGQFGQVRLCNSCQRHIVPGEEILSPRSTLVCLLWGLATSQNELLKGHIFFKSCQKEAKYVQTHCSHTLYSAAMANLNQARPNILPQIFLTVCYPKSRQGSPVVCIIVVCLLGMLNTICVPL